MTTEEYAEKNGWKLQPWSGENSQDLKVWAKEFDEDHKVLVGHGVFTTVVFDREGKKHFRTRRNGHGDFIPEIETLTLVDNRKGKQWEQSR